MIHHYKLLSLLNTNFLMQKIGIIVLLVLFGTACVKDKPQAPIKTIANINSQHKIFVVNEGNYGWGNASVSLFDEESGVVVDDYYKQQNANAAIGDVCQSMVKFQNHYYLVVNNSNKIIELNAGDFKKTAVVTGLQSPRYMLPVSNSKAYVSDLYSNSIQVVDLNTKSVSKSIACSGWTEQMATLYGNVFVTNIKSDYCYVIDAYTDLISDSVLVGEGANSLVFDKYDKLWMMVGGNTSNGSIAKLLKINPANFQIESSFVFGASDSPGSLTINKTKDTLYFLNKGVFQMPIVSTQLPASPLIQQGSKLFYGLGVNPYNHHIYVSDAIDYVQKSKIEIYSVQGQMIKSFNAGIISGQFLFD